MILRIIFEECTKTSTCTILEAADSGARGPAQAKVIISAELSVATWCCVSDILQSEDTFNLGGIRTNHCSATKPCFCVDRFKSARARSAIIYPLSFVRSERIQRGFFKKCLDREVTHVVLAGAGLHLLKGSFHDFASICFLFFWPLVPVPRQLQTNLLRAGSACGVPLLAWNQMWCPEQRRQVLECAPIWPPVRHKLCPHIAHVRREVHNR